MCHGLDDAMLGLHRRTDEVFAIAGGATAHHAQSHAASLCLTVKSFEPFDHCGYRIATVYAIVGVEQFVLGSHRHNLRRGAARVDTYIYRLLTVVWPLGLAQRTAVNLFAPCLVVGWGGEDGWEGRPT